jgi:hypothetical protein
MQKTQVIGKLVLPTFFIPIQIGGIALAGLGLLGLNSGSGATSVNAFPALAGAAVGWVLLSVGAVVAIANGLRLQRTTTRSSTVAASTADLESSVASYPSETLPLRAPITLLPPIKNKVTAVIAGAAAVLIFTALACVILFSALADASPEFGLMGFALLLLLIAMAFGLIASSWITARVELLAEGSVSFRGLFTRRRFANTEIVSARLSANGRRQFLVIRTASSFFSVSSYSFSLPQLDLIKKFCDPQGRVAG